jgi:hypothetical protein
MDLFPTTANNALSVSEQAGKTIDTVSNNRKISISELTF